MPKLLAAELAHQGYEVSSRTVLRLLHQLGYSLQANAKVTEGTQHPDRHGQFAYLNDMATSFISEGQPDAQLAAVPLRAHDWHREWNTRLLLTPNQTWREPLAARPTRRRCERSSRLRGRRCWADQALLAPPAAR